ncbi:hypothetical protein A3K79_05975 [Candidatus Bathyarchaeota archaeon RBG_13_46_16b]|nr:MAG: hypothetical protein A3K79_05975 [Candidatus Bathyarchaeota archaeon RBG_13_46_16b]
MLGFYENFPETIHGIARFSVSFSTKKLQQTLIATFQKLNSKTYSIETLAAPSIRKCTVDFEFGIAEDKGFNYIDNEETAKALQALQKKPFRIMDFLCALRYHKTQAKGKTPLRFDYFMVRLSFSEDLMEIRVSHERGPRHVEPEDIIRLIVDETNQAFKKKALRMLDLA